MTLNTYFFISIIYYLVPRMIFFYEVQYFTAVLASMLYTQGQKESKHWGGKGIA